MGRNGLIALGVVDCAFGVTALTTDGALSEMAYVFNFTLAVVLMVLTWQDLRSRGWSWQAPLAGVSYVAAPLIGLIAYVALSFREPEQETARPA